MEKWKRLTLHRQDIGEGAPRIGLKDGRQQAVEGIVKLKNNLHERRLLFVQLLQHLLYGTLQLGILATQLRLGRVVDLDVGL